MRNDAILVEIASVVAAVRSAVETQQFMTEYNLDRPEDKRIELRVGINFGDVVIDGYDMLGCPGFRSQPACQTSNMAM